MHCLQSIAGILQKREIKKTFSCNYQGNTASVLSDRDAHGDVISVKNRRFLSEISLSLPPCRDNSPFRLRIKLRRDKQTTPFFGRTQITTLDDGMTVLLLPALRARGDNVLSSNGDEGEAEAEVHLPGAGIKAIPDRRTTGQAAVRQAAASDHAPAVR